MHQISKSLLLASTKSAIMQYAGMSRTNAPPPESFVQHLCALYIWQQTGRIVRVEFPARDCAHLNFDRSRFEHLSRNFLVDLVCLRSEARNPDDIEALVEFKLWTASKHVGGDVSRLREFLSFLPAHEGGGAKGYVVCVPHYPNIARVREAISAFSGRFRLPGDDPHTSEVFETGSSGAAAGIVVLDVQECRLS
ncbi:hypothetical protein XH83_27710 [Bradyrhizobium sp. CCBAU 53351]|uniref:hypothetical protein n=1 Tax=Bradyrhizobium sp. CCBAU 53351 TaxID=1325114 RepID=UPI0018870287|nr:hypothetical protein [Bradyrhizobium sp. CCBAU 53351]QOZ78856.1 hypothetical protein XH83_27710 [Bradyrhizobium sp. CCBAU 53351]